jgi:hypothetical protein
MGTKSKLSCSEVLTPICLPLNACCQDFVMNNVQIFLTNSDIHNIGTKHGCDLRGLIADLGNK